MLTRNSSFIIYTMYIRAAKKKNGVTNTRYSYLQLVENIRTENGPRQKLILNLGNLDIHPSQYPTLAKRIEELLTGQQSLLDIEPDIEKHARTAFQKIFNKKSQELPADNINNSQPVDFKSKQVEADRCRSIGPEYVCHSVWQELALNNFFKEQNIPQSVIPILETTVIGRLCSPGSEMHTQFWAQNCSAVYDLLGNPQHTSLGSFYRAADRLLNLSRPLEKYLAERETTLFSLENKYLFFDLTNSYFEGQCKANPKAQFGRSKEKRSDCRLVALGMVVDERGFPKGSRFFSANRSEPTTLQEMIDSLEQTVPHAQAQKRTVVMDAGLASEENIRQTKERGYSYIVVNRGKIPEGIDYEGMQTIRGAAGSDTHIEVKRFEHDGEAFVICRSEQKRKKEEAMRMRIETLFVDRLKHIKAGLEKSGKQIKRYDKVVESIGRIKEKYPAIAKYYDITVVPENTNRQDNKNIRALDITWQKKEVHAKALSEEGCYLLKTDRLDLKDQEIWELYIMLRRIEYSFLCLKSHLGLRPNFHQKEHRVDAHMFISVLAYHILQIIEQRLRDKNCLLYTSPSPRDS